MQTSRGKFITVEGQDGAGKTTNISFVHGLLSAAGHDIVLTREPGGTPLGEELRDLVLNRHDLKIDSMAELLVIFAARAQHLAELIVPALTRGQWVLCDRFTDATYAYQGGGRSLSEQHIQQLENLVQDELRPDLTLLLDVDLNTGQTRAQERSAPDRFESEQDRFKRSVRAAYLERVHRDPDRIKIIDAAQELAVVQQQIENVVTVYLQQNL